MKTIVILMDSLNRNMLKVYNSASWVKTPNIDRLASKSVVFDNHWLGSAPCMPARRDIFTGRLNFLERGWGPIEPFDVTLQEILRKGNIFTHITTDHTHYVEMGGENYIQLFNTWDIHRGQELDTWASRVNQPSLPEYYYGKASVQYELNRSRFQKEEDFPTQRTFASACTWLQENKDADNYFLMVEAFDPHEPFDCTQEYIDMYHDDYTGPRFDWSTYAPVTEPDEALEHLKKRYAGTLTMADQWLGKLLDVLDDNNMWEDTLVVFTTDHGHLLGEHGWTGKNRMPAFNDLSHLPCMVHLPGSQRAGERVSALTQNIDIMPTLLEYFGLEIPNTVKGHSLMKILEGKQEKVRDIVLYGWHGMAVNITDGKYTYFRAPAHEDNYPCYAYCGIPTALFRFVGKECAEQIESGRFLERSLYPVYKIPAAWKGIKSDSIEYVNQTMLFDIDKDYTQEVPLKDIEIEQQMVKALIGAMKEAEAPKEQYERLGLA